MRAGRIPKDERGATATEYALLIAFIALALVLGVTAFGNGLSQAFDGFATWVDAKAAIST